MTNLFDRDKTRFEEIKLKRTNQRLAELQHRAQQPRHATEADVKTDKKTRKWTESVAADDKKHGDIFSTRAEVGSTSLTRFNNIDKPPASKTYIGDALVNEGA